MAHDTCIGRQELPQGRVTFKSLSFLLYLTSGSLFMYTCDVLWINTSIFQSESSQVQDGEVFTDLCVYSKRIGFSIHTRGIDKVIFLSSVRSTVYSEILSPSCTRSLTSLPSGVLLESLLNRNVFCLWGNWLHLDRKILASMYGISVSWSEGYMFFPSICSPKHIIRINPELL